MMSLDFWTELLAIALAFGIIIYLMPRIRNYSLHKQQAVNLRVRISERISACLPAIAATITSQIVDAQLSPATPNSSNSLEYTLQRLKALMTESSVLYSDESARVQRFIDDMTKVLNEFKLGKLSRRETEDLVLAGQRILLDLKENGLLSPVK